jgi:hypothetical protein
MEAGTKYAKSGDVHIAYRVFGEGPRDVVLVPGTVSHVELFWELPINAYLLKRLASFARVIVSTSATGVVGSGRRADARRAVSGTSWRSWMQRVRVARPSTAGPKAVRCASCSRPSIRSGSGLILYGTYASMQAPPWW